MHDRMIRHALGEARVPASPQRVVVLETGALDCTLALGITPIGAATALPSDNLSRYLEPRTEGIRTVGNMARPDLAAVAVLKPDLILTSTVRHKALAERLALLAPTVFTESVGATWKENLTLYAQALNRSEVAERLLGEYAGRVDEFRRRMGKRPETLRVSAVRSLPGHARIYLKRSFIGTILEDAGLPRPPAQDRDMFAVRATEHRIPDLDGDVVFIFYYGRDEDAALDTLIQHPDWMQLGAVKRGRVYEVDDEAWALGLGPLAAGLVLDDLHTYLAR
ncbi:MAG: ABC transporter substrate-binding protein [Chloroflexi bacterium]|nr:ABC transporter substrate-binding protein [Chloroflexota bacterium]